MNHYRVVISSVQTIAVPAGRFIYFFILYYFPQECTIFLEEIILDKITLILIDKVDTSLLQFQQ